MNPKSEFKNTCFERIEKWVEASFDNISQLFRGPPKLAYIGDTLKFRNDFLSHVYRLYHNSKTAF
jgi:hypothetical protein